MTRNAHRHTGRSLYVVGLLLAAQSACATAGAVRAADWLVIDNASPEPIRVSLDLGGWEVLLGRVDPMRRATLRIPAAAIPPGSASARIRVLPIGAPAASMIPGQPGSAATVFSDPYRPEEFAQHIWRYAGRRIHWMGPYR